MDDKINKSEWEFFRAALKDEARTVIWKVGADVDPESLLKSVMPDLEALAPREEGAEDRSDEEIWEQIRAVLLKAAYATRPHCIRCGECCRAGSPTLVAADAELFVKEILTPRDVFTIREGETVYSSRTGELDPSERELVKLKEKPGATVCTFYEDESRRCVIYDDRPTQCRIQECWNPDKYREIEGRPALSREALLAGTGEFWEAIAHHSERCSFDAFRRAMAKLEATRGQTAQEVLELIVYDQHAREFISDRYQLDSESLDFFFGRPLSRIVELYGLTVKQQSDGTCLLTMTDTTAGS